MMKNTVISFVIAAAISACGGSSQSTAATSTTTTTQASAGGEHHEHGEHHEGGGHHPQLTPAQTAFHDVLRPIWHSEANAARDNNACTAAESLRERAGAIQTETPVESTPPAVMEQRNLLVIATDQLMNACASDRPSVNAKLTEVHTAFHRVIEGH